MLDAMQRRWLPAPVFEDKRTSFLVRFYQVRPDSLALSDAELKVLAYIKEHGSIRRVEAQKLLEINDTKAGYLLQKMQKSGLLRKEGRFKETRYLLP
jgi:DNA-binding MarR family transcriptional regulator